MRSGRRNYGSLPNMKRQPSDKSYKNTRGRKLCSWRIDELEIEEDRKSSKKRWPKMHTR